MTFRSLFRITLIGGSLCACVNQYTSPDGGEIENTKAESTGKELPPETSSERESSETTKPSKEAKDTPDDAKRTPTEASGTCDDRSCVSATDCCSGYQCAFDPERSKVVRYCLPQ